jgi:hypothetical protein
VCKQVWAGEDVTVEGYGYSARGVRSVPSAVQQPHMPLWLHGNTEWATDWVVREGQGWLGMIIGEDRTPTLRTRPIPTVEVFLDRVADVHRRCEAVGRDPDSVEIICTGPWGMLDPRTGPEAEHIRDLVGRLREGGTDWVVFNVCGNDVGASIDAVRWFSDEIIAG